jgi:hypothetical protein
MPDKVVTPPASAMIPQTATPKAGGSAKVDQPAKNLEGATPSQHVLTPKPDPTPDSWYVTRRDALMDGDPGVLPDGSTCAEQRTEYADIAVAEATPPAGPAAALTSIAPAAFTIGGSDFQLVATGTDFAAGDTIVFGPSPLTTTFVSATELDSATIVGSSLQTAGPIPVVIRRGAVDTAPVNFTVS